MQGYVPYVRARRKKKQYIVPLIFLLVTILVITTIIVMVSNKNKKNKIFESTHLYYVYVESSTTTHSLKVKQEVVKSLGGAGKIFEHKNMYYLLTSVYQSKSSAEEVKKNLSQNFENCGILEIETKKISSKNKNLILNNIEILEYLKYIQNFNKELNNNYIKYLSGEMSESKFVSFLLTNKLSINEKIKNLSDIKEKNNLLDHFNNNVNMNLFYIENFLDNFFQSSKKQSLVCELALNISMQLCEMFDNL